MKSRVDWLFQSGYQPGDGSLSKSTPFISSSPGYFCIDFAYVAHPALVNVNSGMGSLQNFQCGFVNGSPLPVADFRGI